MLPAVSVVALIEATPLPRDQHALPEALLAALTAAGWSPRPAPVPDAAERPSVLLTHPAHGPGSVGLELALTGATDARQRRLHRIAGHAGELDLEALVVVSTRARHRQLSGELAGLPVLVALLAPTAQATDTGSAQAPGRHRHRVGTDTGSVQTRV